jgi:VanZ family protein
MSAKPVSKRRVILMILTFVCIAFILVQSLLPGSISSDESGWITEHVLDPIAKVFGLKPFSHRAVRKLAHVAEFTALAALLALCFRGRIAVSGGIGFLIAFLDESVQLFSGRGAQILDVWIDLIGVAFGTLLGFLILRARERSKETVPKR